MGLVLLGNAYDGRSGFYAVYFLSHGLSWALFPVAAALVVRILDVKENFTPWVIIHNWGVIYLYALQAAIWMLYVAGLIDQTIFNLLFWLYGPIRVLVHWRIAYMSLGVPTITAAMGAVVPIIVTQIIAYLVYQAFLPAPGG
jgi:hypothetical protein